MTSRHRSAAGLGGTPDASAPEADARAIDRARRALAASPDEPRALFTLAALLLRAGDPGAGALLPRLERHPGFAGGWLAVADALLAREQQGAALAAAARGLRAEPGSGAGYHLLGRILRAGNRDREALDAFERAVACDPAQAGFWYSLALLRQDLGDASGAAEAYRAALAARADFHEAALNLGVSLGDCGRLDEAMDAYALALRLRPDSFGRIAQALVSGRSGLLFLQPERLRAALAGRAPAV